MEIQRGQRVPVLNLVDGLSFQLAVRIVSDLAIDVSCFGLDAAQRLSDERYMTFFNQPETPCGGVRLVSAEQATTTFQIRLGALPSNIERLVIALAIDGNGTMRQLQSGCALRFLTGTTTSAELAFSGGDFADEKALMLAEIYRKDATWRFCATGQGFNGGLAALVRHFGGNVAELEAPPAPVTRISLEKKVAEQAPQLVTLAKKAQVSLEKKHLTDVQAQVALILDASGSMHQLYSRGVVQNVLDRILPLAIHFDDDGSLECWAFASKPKQLETISTRNYMGYIAQNDIMGIRGIGYGNNEPLVVEDIVKFYRKSANRLPTYIVFISDGGIYENAKIEKLLREAASLPIFWQFVGIGGGNYGVLEHLDDMGGRIVDNCNFFSLDDLNQVSEQELYDRLLNEFPQWLRDARKKGILS
jgi:stress response protein SCP2